MFLFILLKFFEIISIANFDVNVFDFKFYKLFNGGRNVMILL